MTITAAPTWQPGDPLYEHPWDIRWYDDLDAYNARQYVRRIVEVFNDADACHAAHCDNLVRCRTCDVWWADAGIGCWICGKAAR